MTPTLRTCLVLGVLSLVLVAPVNGQTPVGSAFAYQGQLNRTGQPVNGLVDFGFGLFDVPDGGGLIAEQVNLFNVEVVNGRFTVQLDFGPEAFDGAGRWLGILVRFPAGAGDGVLLSPRQPITPVPYALHALNGGGGAGDGHSLDAADGDPVDALVVDNNGRVGVGTTAPLARVHVRAGNLGLSSDAVSGDDLIVEGIDAVLGLYSENRGNAGSAIAFKELDQGLFTNTWGLFRDSSDNGAGLRFTFGRDTRYFANPTIMYLSSEGQVGIGTDRPAGRLSVDGVIESMTGGFRFPDGTLQTTAAGGGNNGDSAWFRSGPHVVYANDDGNVYIGTIVSATARLFVKQAVDGPGKGIQLIDASLRKSLYLWVDGAAEVAHVDGDFEGTNTLALNAGGGRVGIGTAAPEASLHVVGDSVMLPGLRTEPRIPGCPSFSGADRGPNVIGGWEGNSVAPDVQGATISGGGGLRCFGGRGEEEPNTVSADFGTVGGGRSNTASGPANSTVAGGARNTASGLAATVPGGDGNHAGGSYSFAAGLQATVRSAEQVLAEDGINRASGDIGTFVWSDAGSTFVGGNLPEFRSTGPNQFLIRAAGGVGIGTNSPAAGFLLDVAGNIRCVSLTETSSRSLKKNIKPIEGALDKVSRLQGVAFNWTCEGGGKADLGFVAEDVAKVLPELVTWEEEGVKASGLKYGHLTAVTVEAIKELRDQVQAKDDRIADLVKENESIRDRLARIEALMTTLAANENGGAQ